jgi:hypothetical protein
MICHNETAKKDQRIAIKSSSLRDPHVLQTKRDYYRLNNNNTMLSRVKSNANLLLLGPDKNTAYIKDNKSTKNYKWDAKQLTTSISRRQQQDKKRIDLRLLFLEPPLFDKCHNMGKTTSSVLSCTEQHNSKNDDIKCLTEIMEWGLVL